MKSRLSPSRERALRGQALSYGSTAGMASHSISRVVRGRSLANAADLLFSWHVQSRAGLWVRHGDTPLSTGSVVEMYLGPVRIPCRVIHVVDEPTRRGFTYATLPGHPECGEESFLLEKTPHGVRFTVTAISKPGVWWVRLGGALARAAQKLMTRRYVRMLDPY